MMPAVLPLEAMVESSIMNWYEWVFSGIGVLVIGYLIQLWVRPGKKEAASLTAQGAKVIGSPVASGDHINQQVNAPVIQHADSVNIGPPVPAQPLSRPVPIAAASAIMGPRGPLPNVVMTGAGVCHVVVIGYGVWAERPGGYRTLAVQFANEARRDLPNVEGRVKALIVYRRGEEEVCRLTGGWLNEAGDTAEFGVDETHDLIVGIIEGQEFTAVAKRRIRVDVNSYEIPTEQIPLPNFHGITVSVRLTHVKGGEVLYEGDFRLSQNPLGIAEIRE